MFLRCARFLVACCCLLAGLVPVMSAQAAPSVSAPPVPTLEAVVQAPVWRDDPFIIILRPDETACRRVFGDEWVEKCKVWPGEENAVVRDIAMSPAVKGRWRWMSDSTSMSLVPEGGWPPDVTYSVDLSKVPLPLGATLRNPTVQATTLPLAAHAEAGEVWINPDVKGVHSLSFALRFTTPPDRAAIEKDLSLKPNNKGLKLAQPSLVWLDGGTRCLVTAKIQTLPKEPSAVRLEVPGVGALVQKKGRWALQQGKLNRTLEVPGASTLFQPKMLKLEAVQNEQLQTEYHVVARFSMRVPADAVQRHLTVHELPLTRDAENLLQTNWKRATITAADMAAGRLLKTERVTLPGESADILRFRVDVTPERYVAMALSKGWGPTEDITLARDYVVSGLAEAPRPGVRFLQPGNVLPLDGDRRVDFVSTDLTRVKWSVRRVLPDRMGMYVLGNMFGSSNPWPDSDVLAVSDTVNGEMAVSAQASAQGVPQPVFHSLDLGPLFLHRPESPGGPVTGLMLLELTGYKDGEETNSTRRMVLVTDLGLVLKEDSQRGLRAFVCSLGQGGPVAGVRVSVIGVNGLPVAEAVTDAAGLAILPAVKGLEREKKPRAVVATLARGGLTDVSWMSLDDAERQLDYSRFSVQGQQSSAEGLNAYVFSQRGIYRPGETLHFGFMLRQGDWKSVPKNMPLVAILRDAEGTVVLRRAITAGDGLGELSWTSSVNAPTGRYRLALSLPSDYDDEDMVLGSGVVRVDEFQPETLSAKAELEASGELLSGKGWIRPGTDAAAVAARVTLRNLYGLPAANRRVQASLSLSPATLQFAGFESYTFADMEPWRGEALNRTLPEVLTGADGRAHLPLGLDVVREGTLTAYLSVEGFEPNGGRAVTTDRPFLVSSLPYMLGYRAAGSAGNLEFIPRGSEGGLEFVAVDPELAPAKTGPLVFEVAERRYVTSLVADAGGKFRYDETPVDTPLSSSTHKLPTDGPLLWALPTERTGEFLLTVREGKRVLARVPFTVAGDGDLRPALEDIDSLPSTQLRVRLDKTDYAAGETVHVAVSSPFDGVGLLTLERDSVAAHMWFKARAGHSVQQLKLPAGFEGRGYINVSLARSLSSPDIFLQPHTFAVAPLTVNVDQREQGLRITAPARGLPGKDLEVRVSSAKAGKVIVFAVDEGVLQLTRFATPDPLRYLLLDRALEVGTRQFFDRLMPDHRRIAKNIPAFGGGMDIFGPGRFQNPFKRRGEPPLAWWSGIVELGPEGRDFKIPIPDYYNGQVRIMAVGLSADAAGQAEASSILRAPLVLTPQLPVMAAPGDRFEAALALANGGEEPLRITLAVKADPALQLTTVPPASVDLAPGEERVVPMEVLVQAEPGNAALHFIATDESGRETRRSVSMSVRPSTLPFITVENGRAATSQRLVTGRELLAFGAAGSASVSTAPLPPLRGLLRYLQSYPYGCVEQSLSRAFPLLLLYRNPALDAALREGDPATLDKERRATLDQAFAALRGALDSDGVRFWPTGDGEGDLFLTAYAADWLLALSEAELGLPGDLLPLFNTLDNLTRDRPGNLEDARVQAYAIWVLTRVGFITTQKLELLAEALDSMQVPADPVFSLMAGSYAALRMDAEAAKALARASGQPSGAVREPLNAVATQALHVAVLARHFPQRLQGEADKLTASLLVGLNGPSGYATFAAAQSARALLALTAASPVKADPLAGADLICSAVQPGFRLPAMPTRHQQGLLTLDAPGCAAYELRLPAGSPPVYWEVESAGYDRQPSSVATSRGLSLKRTMSLSDGTVLDTASGRDEVPQGSVVRVELLASLDSGPTTDVVLADLLPGGFEMVLNHEGNTSSSTDGRIERREDRFIVHVPLETSVSTFVYHIRAVNKGHYSVPATRAEGLYNRALSASTASGDLWVK